MTSTSIYPSVNPISQSKTEIFISKARIVHSDLYNYDFVEYIHNKTKVKIECKIHGIFEQIPNNHLSGNGCSKCNKTLSRKSVTSDIKDIIIKAISIHGELYDYSQVNYINTHTKIKILCKIHGIFEQTPANHLNGQGCATCGGHELSDTNTFISRAKNVHGELYDYGLVEYTGANKKVKIGCKVHGAFAQLPSNHLVGKGCIKCTHIISKPSTKWLESLNISDLILEYRLSENKRKAVDGYSPSTNTVYQFHGDYWHGNPERFNPSNMNKRLHKTYGELYRKTIESDLWILSLGYNLVIMWESEFNKKI